MKINYQTELERQLSTFINLKKAPRLLLHACCAPCSSYVLEYLTEYFDITVLFYNPNITDVNEYQKRADELLRLIREIPKKHPISAIICDHESAVFYDITRGLEELPEGGERCFHCYRKRLEKTAAYLAEHTDEYDCFTTTLTVSPHKNAQKLNEIGLELGEKYGIKYLVSDFKKNEGFKRSIELSREYGLYRQDYCGCEYSRASRDEKR